MSLTLARNGEASDASTSRDRGRAIGTACAARGSPVGAFSRVDRGVDQGPPRQRISGLPCR